MAFRTRLKRKLYTSAAGRTVIKGSKAIHLPGLKGFSLFEIWPTFIKQLRRTSLVERGAAISFNIFMAIPPTLIFVFTLIPYLPISDKVIGQLFALIRDVMPGEKDHSVIIDFLDDFFNRPRNELLSFGLLLALFFSSNAMMGVLRSFDKNYNGFWKRKQLQKRKVALLLTIIIYVLIFIAILLLIAQGAVLKTIGVESEWLRSAIHNFRWVIIFFLFFFIVSFLYRHGATAERKWPFITPGAVFCTGLMMISTGLVTFWVDGFNNYNKVYGSISAVFILMILIYVNALALLLGFELNVTLMNMKRKAAAMPVISQNEDKRADKETNG